MTILSNSEWDLKRLVDSLSECGLVSAVSYYIALFASGWSIVLLFFPLLNFFTLCLGLSPFLSLV